MPAADSGLSAGGRASRWRSALLALSAPLLILLALTALGQRSGKDRLQVVPALTIGCGLLATSWVSRRRRRADLLRALREERRPSTMGR
jgi:hypothetical protein